MKRLLVVFVWRELVSVTSAIDSVLVDCFSAAFSLLLARRGEAKNNKVVRMRRGNRLEVLANEQGIPNGEISFFSLPRYVMFYRLLSRLISDVLLGLCR